MADSTGDPVVGATLAGYRIERRLGRGGMSVVYLAEDLALGRKVALKVLAPELSDDAGFRERFRLESRLAASIDHPNVIPIYEAGEAEGQLYIAMRYVEGADLRRLIDEDGALDPARAVELVARAADGLEAAHDRGLVHRDVKPSNVLIASPGEHEHVYLADFGLTKTAESEEQAKEVAQLSGTTNYVAPELITEGAVGKGADLYALGCVLYEALTGHVPFPRSSELETLVAHIDEPAPKPSATRPEVSADLDAVVERAMAKDPSERYASAAELAAAVRATLPAAGRSRRLAVLLAALAVTACGRSARCRALHTSRPSRSVRPDDRSGLGRGAARESQIRKGRSDDRRPRAASRSRCDLERDLACRRRPRSCLSLRSDDVRADDLRRNTRRTHPRAAGAGIRAGRRLVRCRRKHGARRVSARNATIRACEACRPAGAGRTLGRPRSASAHAYTDRAGRERVLIGGVRRLAGGRFRRDPPSVPWRPQSEPVPAHRDRRRSSPHRPRRFESLGGPGAGARQAGSKQGRVANAAAGHPGRDRSAHRRPMGRDDRETTRAARP